MKLYKYRPLSDFLYKELYYQELYFASYKELNDPLDLSARIEFTPESEQQIEYLLYFLLKTTFPISNTRYSEVEKSKRNLFLERYHNDGLRRHLMSVIYEKILLLKTESDTVWLNHIEGILIDVFLSENIPIKLNFVEFKKELRRLTEKFLENSSTTCFSATNNNFLMWSHYASKHSGICLEFNLERGSMFPYIKSGKRSYNHEKYLERISDWDKKERIGWDRINQVEYQDEQPFINFFDFEPVFSNEYEPDLIYLNKGWAHEYAYELEKVFSTKTQPWHYEKEWRAININFSDQTQPEDRIRHYPIEALSAIYFGDRSPEYVKKRVSNIYRDQEKDIQFFSCKITNGKDVEFER